MAFTVGQNAEMTRSFSAADVSRYASLGGHEPAPGDVPEPLVNALFSRLLGVELPGEGTNYLKQDLVDLKTRCVGEHGNLISEGRALVYVADVMD